MTRSGSVQLQNKQEVATRLRESMPVHTQGDPTPKRTARLSSGYFGSPFNALSSASPSTTAAPQISGAVPCRVLATASGANAHRSKIMPIQSPSVCGVLRVMRMIVSPMRLVRACVPIGTRIGSPFGEA
jgi:hypothetical protein